MANPRDDAIQTDRRSLRDDDGGAVLLLGLLFAVTSIGFIWILFQLGDTMISREHANGAADSVALSAAIQHARIMNFVVLFNLIMSAILTVRVVLRVLQIAVLIAAIPTLGVSLAALPPLMAADAATSPVIIAALNAMGMAAGMMILSVPGVAQGTATYIAETYKPVVSRAITTSAGQDAYGTVFGLPLQQDRWGSTQCKKTSAFATDLISYPLEKMGIGFLAKFASKPIRSILGNPVAAAALCGLGVNLEPPEDVQKELQKLTEKFEEDCRKELKAKGVDPTSPGGQNEFKLCVQKYQGPLTAVQDTVQEFINEGANGLLGLTPPTTFMTTDQWSNGSKQWGVLAIAVMDDEPLKSSRLVNLAGFGKRKVGDLPAGANRAVAQAEFYYDCQARWTEDGCDAPHEPVWNFRWKARMTPVFGESPTLTDLFDPMRAAVTREFDAAGPSNTVEALKKLSKNVRH